MSSIQINGRRISTDDPAFIIAEIGVNHDGSLARALELVEIAAESGADAVKLQIFRAETLMSRSAGFAQYQEGRVEAGDPVEMLRKYELSPQAVRSIVESIGAHGLVPIATPFSPPDLIIIEELGLPAIKIASPDIVNRPLLLHAAQLRKPLLVSCGAANMAEIEATAGWLGEWNVPFAFLHCISCYPTPADDAHLGWIGELSRRFDVPVGYSDHTTEPLAGALAIAAGACVIEKHLTYDRNARGPDHSASADGAQFRKYVSAVRLAERVRGTGAKRVLPIEEDVRSVSRQSVVLRRSLHPGDIVRAEDLCIQRPGTGIPPAELERVIGRKVRVDMEAGRILEGSNLYD